MVSNLVVRLTLSRKSRIFQFRDISHEHNALRTGNLGIFRRESHGTFQVLPLDS
jgi:hypothetical protein